MARLSEWDPKQGRTGSRRWRKIIKDVCPPGSLCGICGEPIVFGLRPNHPLGPTVDHITDLQYGGHPTALSNLRPAHRKCNSGKRRPKNNAPVAHSRAFPSVDSRNSGERVLSREFPPVDPA